MNGLKTARAVIVDNNVADGAAILRALSEYGIGASFFTGNPDELPDEKLKGIRFLALDMDLANAGPGEARQVLSPLIGVVTRLIADRSAPFVVLAWTQYPDLVQEFQQMLKEARPDLNPSFFVTISKAEVRKEDSTGFDIEKIVEKLNENAKNWFPFDLIMDWEQRVHDAATETTYSLNEIIDKNGDGDLADKASRLFAALALASGGQIVHDKAGALKHLFSSLDPIHEDRLENLPINVASLEEQAEKLIKLIAEERQRQQRRKGERSFLSAEQRGKLNNMLLLASVTSGEYSPRPGNIYLRMGWGKGVYPFGKNGIDHTTVVAELCILPDAENKPEERQKIIRSCVPALVEITPACDYSQGNVKYARLVAGVFVPGQLSDKIKKNADFARIVGPMEFEREKGLCNLSGTYYLVLNSRYILGISIQKLSENRSSFRLRRQALVDTQAWFARQAARPGYVWISP